jgi:hypothetical protein
MSRIVLVYCPKKQKMVPKGAEHKETKWAKHAFTSDEMEPTKNPLNSKEVFTSKARLREAYRNAGAVEIGDAYERGYDPAKERAMEEKKMVKRLVDQVRERLNG